MILCNADNSNVTNITITGSETKQNNGLFIHRTAYSYLSNSNSSNNYYGLYLYYSDNNTLTSNTANANQRYGIYLSQANNNCIYNNYFDNPNNAYDRGNNTWNISRAPGTNIIGGSWLGGNYWSDYAGRDQSGDRLGDTLRPYNASGNITSGGDWLPLVKDPYINLDVGVTTNITMANLSDLAAYLPSEYVGVNLNDAVALYVTVTDNTPGNPVDDAYTDITINVGGLDIETCKVFKFDLGFLPEVPDVTMLPTVRPPGEPAFSRNVGNNTVTVRLYVGDPLLAVLPPAELPIFDTGEGTYPSIPGTQNGTLTPFYDINVSKLYTYPCPGTGGHTEYVKIWKGSEVIAEKTWNGYTGDWHNLTFNNSFTLYANETYNYTICTGSYPQIIHESPYNATGGTITCEEFVNSNGKRHEDGWIPAIRLF